MFFEVQKGSWYYVLEHYNAPKNAWDWTENADVFGSFGSFEAADKHLSDNHANPGGYNMVSWSDKRTPEEQKRFDELANKAQRPRSRFDTLGGLGGFGYRGRRGW